MSMSERPVRTVSLPERILDFLRTNRGRISAKGGLTQHLADKLQVIDDVTTAEAIHVLRSQGLVVLEGNDTIAVTKRGKTAQLGRIDMPSTPVEHKTRAADKILAYLIEQGGSIEDPKGRCITTLEKELGIRHAGAAIATLVRRGLVEKNARPRVGTVSVRLVRDENPHPSSLDGLSLPELGALGVVVTALLPLKDEMRARVLAIVAERIPVSS